MNYWQTHYSELVSKYAESPLKQVEKTVNGIAVDESQIDLIVDHITQELTLTVDDSLIDLCCGNGLLTSKLARCVRNITGIDFTKALLDEARKRNQATNLSYQIGNVLELSSKQTKHATCFMMYEALQLFSLHEFRQLMSNLNKQKSGTRFFIGGIPDRRNLRNYYDTDKKFQFYEDCEKSGRPHMGHWWLEDEVAELGAEVGYEFRKIHQPDKLYTAYYRFDALLVKK